MSSTLPLNRDAGGDPAERAVDKSPLVGRARQLLSYLEALHRLRHPKHPDGLSGEILVAPALPDHRAVRLHPADHVLLEVDRLEPPGAIGVPEPLDPWVEWSALDQLPVLRGGPDGVRQAFDDWMAQTWRPWRARVEPDLAVRRLFLKLYEQRLIAEQDLATHETVWVHGAAMGPDTGAGTPRLPLFVTPARYEIDDRTGCLRIMASGPPELEIDGFESLVDTFDLLKQIANELLDPPPGASNGDGSGDGDGADHDTLEDDVRVFRPPLAGPLEAEVLERLSRVIADARYLPSVASVPPATDHWQIVNIEGLYHRRRPVHYEAYFRALGHAIDDGYLPDTWSAVLADEPTTAPISRTTGTAAGPWAALDERILSPLPLNEQQRSILTRIAHNAGVTVQGPPGTGKSYAIAALTSHFLTCGLRVLICAEKPHPLRVIRDKMPEELRELCVAVLGDDRAARQQLEASIAAITAQVNAVDPERDQRRLDEVDAHLDQLRRQLAELRDRELEIRQAEQRRLTLGEEEIGVADAARALVNRRDDGWIPDDLDPATPLPLTDEELTELISLTHTLAPGDRSAHGPPLCDPADLVDGITLGERWAGADAAAARCASVSIEVDLGAVAALGREELGAIDNRLRRHRALVDWATGTSWAPIHRAMSSSEQQRQRWRQVITQMDEAAGAAAELGLQLAAHRIELPGDDDGHDVGPLLEELGDRFASGRGLPRLGGGDLKRLVESISVDGRRPSTPADLDLVRAERARHEHRRRLRTLWTNELGPFGLAPLEPDRPEDAFHTAHQASLRTLLDVPDQAAELAGGLGPLLYGGGPDLATAAGIDLVLQRLAAAAALFDRNELSAWLESYAEYVERAAQSGHRCVRTLHEALTNRDSTAWQAAADEHRRLHDLGPWLTRHDELVTRLAGAAPILAATYRGDNPAHDAQQVRAAWRWRQLRHWIDEIVALGDLAVISTRIAEAERQEQRLVTEVVSQKAWLQMARRTTGAQRSALETWAQAMKRMGKGTGKHAPRHRQAAQRAMQSAQNAVPVWIMSIAQAIESFRPGEDTAFDIVIIDEASQAPLDAMAVLGLGQRVLVVGDDKQISPTIFDDETEADRLRRQHLVEVPDADGFDVRTSLYDTASRRFPGVIQLREHFRCLPEIIAFSNDLSYEGRIDPLREQHPDPQWQPVRAVRVSDGYRDGQINRPEADAVVELVQQIIADPALGPGPLYANGATIGVVSMLGVDQAKAIQSRLIELVPVDEIEGRRIRIGSPYEFQGDERDVIIISMVDARTAERPVSGRAATDASQQQRYNVAASRARDQLIVVHSFDPGQLAETDLRRRLVAFARNPTRTSQVRADLRDQCESRFERDVLERLLTLGLRVDAQYPVAGYRIDFTVSDLSGRRVAVECDGDSFHGVDQLRSDTDRQRILERLGWRFVRIRASEFYADQNLSVASLLAQIESHGLQRSGDQPE